MMVYFITFQKLSNYLNTQAKNFMHENDPFSPGPVILLCVPPKCDIGAWVQVDK